MGLEREISNVEIINDGRGWAVDVALAGRRERRRYRYPSEAQARFFAAVFALGPRSLPAGFVRLRAPRSAGSAPREEVNALVVKEPQRAELDATFGPHASPTPAPASCLAELDFSELSDEAVGVDGDASLDESLGDLEDLEEACYSERPVFEEAEIDSAFGAFAEL